MSFLSFQDPIFLILLLSIPLIFLWYKKKIKKKKAAAIKFSHIGFLKASLGKKKNFWRNHLFLYLSLAVIALIILGFSDPHIPLKQSKEGVNVVLSIDVSGSMQATDYQPNRLEAAKRSSKILLESLHTKDHAGVVIFESGATTSAYLSPFKDRVIRKLEGIKAREGKTAVGDGLALAVDMASSIPNKKKIVILLSDGVNNAGVVSPEEAVRYANLNKVQVYTIAMGSDGQAVLGYDFFGRPIYAELDEATLKVIAEQTNGQFFKSVDDKTLNEIYETISSDIDREREPTSIKNWFFAAALLVLLLQIYFRYGKYRILQ